MSFFPNITSIKRKLFKGIKLSFLTISTWTANSYRRKIQFGWQSKDTAKYYSLVLTLNIQMNPLRQSLLTCNIDHHIVCNFTFYNKKLRRVVDSLLMTACFVKQLVIIYCLFRYNIADIHTFLPSIFIFSFLTNETHNKHELRSHKMYILVSYHLLLFER